MVFLTILLIQNDFLPALISDINKFDGYDCDALVKLIEEGIKRTEVLQAYIQSKTNADWCPIPNSLKLELSDMVGLLQKAILSPDFGVKEAVSPSDDIELSVENQPCIDDLMKKINAQFPGLDLSINSPNSLSSMHQFLMKLKQLYLQGGTIQDRTISMAYIRLKDEYPEYMKNFSNGSTFVGFIRNGIAQYEQKKRNSPMNLLKQQPVKSAFRINMLGDTPDSSEVSSQQSHSPMSPPTPLLFKEQSEAPDSPKNEQQLREIARSDLGCDTFQSFS